MLVLLLVSEREKDSGMVSRTLIAADKIAASRHLCTMEFVDS
jgi:hypothetical protein